MRRVFELARQGMGFTGPNPLVGALLVRDGVVIGMGGHLKHGGPHAEVHAILDAKEKGFEVEGATLYCNLEPCVHTHKLTPPCAPLLCREKIAKVVIANIDPNPEVQGKGVEYLRAQGIQVEVGVLAHEGALLNEVFFKFIVQKIPFVHLKMAQSLDGRVATKTGESKYLTGPLALAKVHHLRQKYDAILVGRKTVAMDDPSLTVRSEEFPVASHPRRLVLGSLENIDGNWKILNGPDCHNTMLITTDEDVKAHATLAAQWRERGVALLGVKQNARGRVDLKALLKELGALKISSILVEGGPELATLFLREGLVDKVSFFIAPTFIGEGKNGLLDLDVLNLKDKLDLLEPKTSVVGRDILVEGYLCLPA